MNRLILYLVRRKLGVNRYEGFRFTNQKDYTVYYFNDNELVKTTPLGTCRSGVSLNWLLDPECKIKKVSW